MADPNLTIDQWLQSQQPAQAAPQTPDQVPQAPSGPPLTIDQWVGSQLQNQQQPQQQPQQRQDQQQDHQPPPSNSLDEFMNGFWDTASPAKMWQGAKTAFQHPELTGRALWQQQGEPFQRAREAWQQGEYGEALNHVGNGLLPLIGPQMEAIENLARQGNTARAVGQGVGLAIPIMLTEGAGLGVRALSGVARAGEGVARAGEAAEAAERALPAAETASQTAARVVESGATPEDALQKMLAARTQAERATGLNQLRQIYTSMSPKMKPWVTQQMIMQIAKVTEGDPVAFAMRMAELGKAIPLDQLTAWDTVGHVARSWQSLRTAQHTLKNAIPPAMVQGLPPAAVAGSLPAALGSIDLRKLGYGFSGGGAVERLRRNTLDSLSRVP